MKSVRMRRYGELSDWLMSGVLASLCVGFAAMAIQDRARIDEARRARLETPVADPQITGAIDPIGRVTSQDRENSRALRLLAVIDGHAFVQRRSKGEIAIYPVGVGSMLPGAGRVLAITRDGERWQLTAERAVLYTKFQ